MKARPASSFLDIDTAMSKAEEFPDWDAFFAFLLEAFWFWGPTPDNITLEWYCHDKRTGWDTHLACVDGKAAAFTDGIPPGTPVCNILPERKR